MSKFEVLVRQCGKVENHPNADRLSLVSIEGYKTVSAKLEDGSHRYNEGDLVVYIPEASIIPEWLMKSAGFWDETANRGLLSGGNHDRVKPVRLRGELSEGILLAVIDNKIKDESGNDVPVTVGQDVAEILGITKWVPEIPVGMSGDVWNVGRENTVDFDVENFKAHPNVLKPGEQVVATSKIHGTCSLMIHTTDENENLYHGWTITSKGTTMGANGIALKDNEANRAGNAYVHTMHEVLDNENRLERLEQIMGGKNFIILGEIFGKGVQDLTYGQNGLAYRCFDVYLTDEKRYMNDDELDEFLNKVGIDRVPIVYRGPFDQELLEKLRDGPEPISGKHIQEGIVVAPVVERIDPKIGRVKLKMVSPAYLNRKNGTEYN